MNHDHNNDKYICNPYEPYINIPKNLKETKTVFTLFCIYRDNINLSLKDLSKEKACRYKYNTLVNKSSLYEWTKRRELYYSELKEKESEELDNLRTYTFNKTRILIDKRLNSLDKLFNQLMNEAKKNPNKITSYINSFKQLSDTDMAYFKLNLRLLGLPETIKEDNINLNNDVDLPALQELIQAPKFIEENMKPFELFKEKQLEVKKEYEKEMV